MNCSLRAAESRETQRGEKCSKHASDPQTCMRPAGTLRFQRSAQDATGSLWKLTPTTNPVRMKKAWTYISLAMEEFRDIAGEIS